MDDSKGSTRLMPTFGTVCSPTTLRPPLAQRTGQAGGLSRMLPLLEDARPSGGRAGPLRRDHRRAGRGARQLLIEV